MSPRPRATIQELREAVQCLPLEASLLDDEQDDATLAGALREHRELRARRPPAVVPEPVAEREREPAKTRTRPPRPGDRSRAADLRGRAGRAWSRLFRRYDEFAAALVRLRASSDVRAYSDVGASSDERADGAETVDI